MIYLDKINPIITERANAKYMKFLENKARF